MPPNSVKRLERYIAIWQTVPVKLPEFTLSRSRCLILMWIGNAVRSRLNWWKKNRPEREVTRGRWLPAGLFVYLSPYYDNPCDSRHRPCGPYVHPRWGSSTFLLVLLDSWQEHDLLECVAKAAPGNAEECPRQQHCKSIPKHKQTQIAPAEQTQLKPFLTFHMPCGLEDYYGKKNW